MKNLLGLCLLLSVCAGCSKEEPANSPETTATNVISGSPAASAQPASGQSPQATMAAAKPATQPRSGLKPLEGKVDPGMTALLQKFVREKGRMPQSILELAGATSDGFPLAPAGYLYAIDPATSEVKLVKQ